MRRTVIRDAGIAAVLAVIGPFVVVQTVPAPEQIPLEGWVGMGLAAFVFYLWADHMAHTGWDYLAHRGPRRLRGLMIGILLAAGTLGILMGIIARYVPELADITRFIRWITVGMLLVGGIVTWVTWRWGAGHD